MSLAFHVMYRLGLTPWDHGQVAPELESLVAPLAARRALDLGCGTGAHAIWLAQRGWTATGVDVVELAIARARKRAAAAGVTATFVAADATDASLALGGPFDLVLDVGCFHVLGPAAREQLVRAYARHAAPGAHLAMFVFAPRRGPGPRGASRAELEQRLGAQWTLLATKTDEHTPAPKPLLRGGRPSWLLWQRR